MGDLANGLWYHEDTGKGWNCTKCANDKDFALPYVQGDELYFQLRGYEVSRTHLCDWTGARVITNLSNILGAANWRKNKPKSVYTLRIPPEFEMCSSDVSACCTIDLAGAAAISPAFPNLEYYLNQGYFDGLRVQGTVTNILAGLPAGWSYGETGWVEHIKVPCEMLGFVVLEAHRIGDPPGTWLGYEVPVIPCLGRWCDCYITVNTPVGSVVEVIIDGVSYAGPTLLTDTPITVPGFTAPAKHIISGEGFQIPIKCSLLNSTIEFVDTGGTVYTGVFSSANCTTYIGRVNGSCWMIEFEIDNGDSTFSSIYSEPYECVLCEDTVQIRSDYRNVNEDCLGQYYDLSVAAMGGTATGALLSFKNTLRIPAIVRNLPARFGVTTNSKCFNYKSEITERYELQGTKAIPPYLSRMIENVMVGSDFYSDDNEYQVRGESAFELISEKAVSAYRLKAQLESCVCEVNFDC